MTPALILHGGAGSMRDMDPSREQRYRAAMRDGARAAATILRGGGTALDAVCAAVEHMEDGGVFNAGLGACLTDQGGVEMDAAVMRGDDRGFGAVASVQGVKSPVRLARLVMERTPHCFLVGRGAESLAHSHDLPFREDFPSAARLEDWARKRKAVEAATPAGAHLERLAALAAVFGQSRDFGPVEIGGGDTVGACAIDRDGHLAAAVSTGGIWLKMSGRVGDSPLPGGGLWAVDGRGAAVATGTGETILRVLLCREAIDDPAAGPTTGAQRALDELTRRFGDDTAGLVTLGPDGSVGYALNTGGMGRATWNADMAEPACAIFPNEAWDRPGVRQR